MTRPAVEIGDRVAVIATVVERINDRVTLSLDGNGHLYSMVEPNAKAGDKLRLEGDVVHVDEDLGRTTVQVLGRVTVDTGSVEMVTRRCDLDHIGSNVSDHPRPRTQPRPHG
ncbi:MAG: hypothetical protein EOQ50_13795 [Mesorhizobium sp.]|uniref:hypothetical protein n=1 Tax=Mesorhizobium sp. TaxID=1871066 RepID=UPI000FEA070E|nr:hypothetical protein [Mesorhizobium sp.]RWB75356.1 MAG: hypothetical protein EOQ50_13795 [Mesorhizobium sp.]RWL83458.1 MAG: hypothetical protein EOR69_11900 [Mesorhizobium sp.]RWL90611.1 MAG: hypothetical protein EOR67_04240 [Mesorhizobium sp.]RWL99658.1 MAG: hypothetical protein EOR68_13565 [Mesorhizobium sp.]RWM00199.1 MAG: hypothetical protein EOR70_09470 [Mesorhizobium sp.]